ncbi:MAG: gluconate 2-dehydrogenase subunit 3 family protein [Bryobacteraceae bacterium]|jgi:gluconate 2-dehydrogenase gamma chain
MRTGEKSLNRRKFLATAAATGAAACSRTQNSPWRALTDDEAQTLGAWCECLIPEDSDPGAKRAGVVRYIDVQLTKKYKRHRKLYARVLASVNVQARRGYSHDFAALPLETRTALLEEFEKGPDRAAFNLILDHTLQGYYGNPRHGGNADYASWRMLGVTPVPVRGRLQYSILEPASKGGQS